MAKSRTLWLQSCFIHVFLMWTEIPFIQEVSGGYTSPFLHTDELKMALLARRVSEAFEKWAPELLGHKGNNPWKWCFFPLPLPPIQCWCQAFKSFSSDSTLLGEGGQKKWFTKTTLPTFFLRGGFRVYLTKCIFSLNFHNCPMMFWPRL